MTMPRNMSHLTIADNDIPWLISAGRMQMKLEIEIDLLMFLGDGHYVSSSSNWILLTFERIDWRYIRKVVEHCMRGSRQLSKAIYR